MIISDKYQFAFMHIPKCAGSTVRHALAPFDEAAERYHNKAVAEHPVLKRLDHHHIPLAVLKEHFSDDFERLENYSSFALVRDPFTRFPSSLHERFTQRNRKSLGEFDIKEVAKEVDVVLDKLSRHPKDSPIIDPELIHFSRQKDFIFFGGQQVVKTVRTLGDVKDMLGEISQIVGRPILTDAWQNNRYYHTYPIARAMQSAITRPIERALPRKVWKPVFNSMKSVLLATGLIRPGGNPLPELPNADEIEAFISEFYADDIRLVETVNAARNIPQRHRNWQADAKS